MLVFKVGKSSQYGMTTGRLGMLPTQLEKNLPR